MSVGKTFPSLRWPGGKVRLAPYILPYVPKRGRKFVDLSAGRGNFTLRAIAEGFEYEEWVLNDILTAPYLRAIRDYGDKFKATERSKAERDKLAHLAKHGDPHALLMEPLLCFNGGTYAHGGYFPENRSQRLTSYEACVHLACKIIRDSKVRITALDWLDCLEAEQLGPDDFVFIDFPYIGCAVGAYSPESICPTEVIEYLKTARFQWVMTEYDQPLYRQAFGDPIFHKDMQLRTINFARTNQQRRKECIWTNIGKDWAKRDTVTVQPVPVPDDRKDTYYVDLPLQELLREIKESIFVISAARNQMNAEMRQRLLLALKELKKRTFRKKPNYYETLAAMGLNGDTVRQWFYRSRTANEVIELVEEKTEQHDSGGSGDETLQGVESVPSATAPNSMQFAFSTNTSEWYTPARYVDLIREVLDGIELDPASCEAANKIVCAERYYTMAEDGLAQPWNASSLFLNPPYEDSNGKSQVGVWVQRLLSEFKSGHVLEAILLVNASTSEGWFQALYEFPICFTNHRIHFNNPEGKGDDPPKGNAFVYLGNNPAKFAHVFESNNIGVVLSRYSGADFEQKTLFALLKYPGIGGCTISRWERSGSVSGDTQTDAQHDGQLIQCSLRN